MSAWLSCQVLLLMPTSHERSIVLLLDTGALSIFEVLLTCCCPLKIEKSDFVLALRRSECDWQSLLYLLFSSCILISLLLRSSFVVFQTQANPHEIIPILSSHHQIDSPPLATKALRNGTQAILSNMADEVPISVEIDPTFKKSDSNYTPRPLGPNSFTGMVNNVSPSHNPTPAHEPLNARAEP